MFVKTESVYIYIELFIITAAEMFYLQKHNFIQS